MKKEINYIKDLVTSIYINTNKKIDTNETLSHIKYYVNILFSYWLYIYIYMFLILHGKKQDFYKFNFSRTIFTFSWWIDFQEK